ncbi:hypothetical protein BC936DRAFT_145698 [Jimgerdemannia flammicorona]|uniref:CCAAT-binding factor domain-containing protein n=1 Tax=Jimgerdemannia flammicorona TaxID=994334 RepID=A0A433D9G3_9FUNG|nr:hypothetical protein BC936DRAFT_145698 [Jimgerdemannia flammicorona]
MTGSKHSTNGGKAHQQKKMVRPFQSTAKPLKQNSHKHGEAKKAHKNNAAIWGEELLEEVLQLGGSKEDLEFLNNVDLDEKEEELVTEASKDEETGLTNDVESFMKGLGLDVKKFAKELEVDDEEEVVEEGWEDSDDENRKDELEEDEIEETPVSSSAKVTGKAKLVSISTHPAIVSALCNSPISQVVPPSPKWHELALPPLAGTPPPSQLSDALINQKLIHAKNLLTIENTNSENHPSLSSSDRSFLSTILGSGTVNDKVSALTLLAQESPIHAIKTMDTLMAMAKKKGRKEAVMAVTSLKDLFVGSVLPDRKLRYLRDQSVWDKKVTEQHWIVWAFEDHLKKLYFEFIQLIEALSHDPLSHVRHNMLTCIYDLLVAKPEQEQNLLKLLVNKLGDSENKVSAKVSYLLQQLLLAHPAMKLYVVREVEHLILRPNVSERAQYYGIVTVNQTILTARDVEVANKLVDIYFIFFRKLLAGAEKKVDGGRGGKKSEADNRKKQAGAKENKNKKGNDEDTVEDGVDSKMVAAVLTGVNRAFPFAKVEDVVYESNMDILFRITHTGTFNTSIQALMLIFQVSSAKQSISDRFYRTLYESLLDHRLVTSSKQAMYLNLLFKALRADSDVKRVKAFVKRIVQMAAYHQPPFVCGAFYLISEVRVFCYCDHPRLYEYIYIYMTAPGDSWSYVMAQQPGLRALVFQPEEDDEEERFVDMDENETDYRTTKGRNEAGVTPLTTVTSQKYDGRKRDPQYSNADKTCLWELSPFTTHFHPSVALYAFKLLNGEKIDTQPELHLHTLSHFLDRFVYRNAKKQQTTKGGSIMQPLGASANSNMMTLRRGTGVEARELNVNSHEFWRKKVEDVPADQIFFHKYFTQKLASDTSAGDKRKDKKVKPADDNDFLGEQDEDEDEVWKAMVGSIPGGIDDLPEDDDEEKMSDEDDEEMRALLMGDSDDELDDEDGEELDMAGDDWEDVSGEEEMEGEKAKGKAKKRKASEKDGKEGKAKRQRLKDLPTFASFEEYAAMLDD